jgi:hypothetical protein
LQAGASAMMAMKRIALLRVKCDPDIGLSTR